MAILRRPFDISVRRWHVSPDGMVDMAMLESAVRDHLNRHAPRAMYGETTQTSTHRFAGIDDASVSNHPADPQFGDRQFV